MTAAQAETRWEDPGTEWALGPWSFVLRGDELANLQYAGHTVLRSIRAVVRDGDWNTAEWAPSAPDHRYEAGAEVLRLPLRSTGFGSDIRGDLSIEARGESLTVTFDAVSHGAFATNRTGLVVLHPADLAGAPLYVQHDRGARTDTVFPVAISPHQPVLDIRSLEWEAYGLRISTEFDGDVFEMEDQRNWTDASYKTYSRPLSLPFPYELRDGERVHQGLKVAARPGKMLPLETDRSHVIILRPAGPFPVIGVASSEAPDPAPALPAPIGTELLVELDMRSAAWPAALERAALRGVPLDVRVVARTSTPHEFDALAARLREAAVARVAVFSAALHVSDEATVAALRGALSRAGIRVSVYGGSRSHFTELNREHHLLPKDLDGIVTTVTPLFHSLSTAQLIESVAMQRLIAQQTVAYAAGRPVRIGPIALRPRFNNVAMRPQPMPHRNDLREGIGAEFTGAADERQSAPELAAWVIASAAALAVPGVTGISYFEEWGPRGIRANDGSPHPVAAALDALASLRGIAATSGRDDRELLTGDSPDGLVWAIGARGSTNPGAGSCINAGAVSSVDSSTGPGHSQLLAANIDAKERSFEVAWPGDESTIAVTLPAFSWGAFAPHDGERMA